MNWKEMFKPSRKKVALAVVLCILFSSVPEIVLLIANPIVTQFGLPLIFYTEGTNAACVHCGEEPQMFYLNLAVDIVFWYLVTCILLAYRPKQSGR